MYQLPPAQKSARQPELPQAVPAERGTSVHADVPLQLRVRQSVDAQSIGVPTQPEAPQASPHVHGLPSSQLALARHCQTPPSRVQEYVVPPQAIV